MPYRFAVDLYMILRCAEVVAPYKYYLFFLSVIGVGAVFAQVVFIE